MNVDTLKSLVHVVMFTPGGMVVCQKFDSKHYIKKWEVTEHSIIPVCRMNDDNCIIESAVNIIRKKFLLTLQESEFRHVASSVTGIRRLEIVACNVPSGSRIHTNEFTTIRLATVDDLAKEINEDCGKFDQQSIRALNIITTMCGEL